MFIEQGTGLGPCDRLLSSSRDEQLDFTLPTQALAHEDPTSRERHQQTLHLRGKRGKAKHEGELS